MLLRALIDRDGEVVGVSADLDDSADSFDLAVHTDSAESTDSPAAHAEARPHRPGDRISTLRIPDPTGGLPLLELHRRLSYDRKTGELHLADRPEPVGAR